MHARKGARRLSQASNRPAGTERTARHYASLPVQWFRGDTCKDDLLARLETERQGAARPEPNCSRNCPMTSLIVLAAAVPAIWMQGLGRLEPLPSACRRPIIRTARSASSRCRTTARAIRPRWAVRAIRLCRTAPIRPWF